MNRKTVSGIMLTLLLIGMLTLAFNVIPATASLPVHNIDTGLDYATIQEAIDAPGTLDGHTILVDAGIYYENVVVNKSNLTLLGENKSITIIDGYGKGTVVFITASNVDISGFTVKNSGSGRRETVSAGVHLIVDANSNNISGNIVTNNEFGILIWGSGNTITENRIKNNWYGMYLSSCSNNVLSSNNMSENVYNFGVKGRYLPVLSDYIQNIDTSNLVNEKPVYYLSNQRDLVIDSSTFPEIGYLGLVNSTNIVVSNLSLVENEHGVLFAYTTNSTLININASNNRNGICLVHSSGNTVIRNTLTDNYYFGLLSQFSDSNNINGNTIGSNRVGGICLASCSSNTIIANNVSGNEEGMEIGFCNNNILYDNNFVTNTIQVVIGWSNNNLLYHNNFVSDRNRVISEASINQWDDGYPSGGNYWSDYEEWYPDAEELDDSGIWDTPYVIDENNQDNYPLMEPWTPTTPVPTTISELKTEIEELGSEGEIDNQGIVKSLIAKLNVAQKLVDKGKIHEAKRILEKSFIVQVQNLSNIHIILEAAELLIESAEYIISHL